MKMNFRAEISDDTIYTKNIFMGRTRFETQDSIWYPLFPKEVSGKFSHVNHIMDIQEIKLHNPVKLFSSIIYLDPHETILTRRVVTFNDVLGMLGGCLRVVFIIMTILITPYAQYIFYLNAARRMFLARTRDPSLLQKTDLNDQTSEFDKKIVRFVDPKNIPSYYSHDMRHEIKKHKVISISNKDWLLLFIYHKLGNMACNRICRWRKREKLTNLYATSKDKLESKLNLFKLLR